MVATIGGTGRHGVGSFFVVLRHLGSPVRIAIFDGYAVLHVSAVIEHRGYQYRDKQCDIALRPGHLAFCGGIPTKVPDEASVRPDVQLINCGQTKGGWSAGGTVQNSLRRRTTYIITVFFTSAQATDLASAVTSVPLAAGKSKFWSTQATFPLRAKCCAYSGASPRLISGIQPKGHTSVAVWAGLSGCL